MSIDSGSRTLLEIMRRSVPGPERNVVLDAALRDAGHLEVPMRGPEMEAFVDGPFRRAAVTKLGPERGELLADFVLDTLALKGNADTIPPAATPPGKTTLPRLRAVLSEQAGAQPVRVGRRKPATTLEYPKPESSGDEGDSDRER